MMPASFAKLCVRMLAAALLLMYLPSQFAFIGEAIILNFQQLAGLSPGDFWAPAFLVIAAGGGFVLWWQADWFGRLLLPAGADRAASPDYRAWQETGLSFVGGWLLLEGSCGLWVDIFGNSFYVTGHYGVTHFFDLLIGTQLFIGFKTILVLPIRIFRTNWWRVLMRLRAKP